MLFGGGNTEFWHDVFILAKGFKPIYATVQELIMTKYLRNSFLATKVAFFFNEVYDFCNMNNLEYDKIKELVGMDERITTSPCRFLDPMEKEVLEVHVFPKDTRALLSQDCSNLFSSF